MTMRMILSAWHEVWFLETDYRLPYFFNFEHYGMACKGPYDEDFESDIYIPAARG